MHIRHGAKQVKTEPVAAVPRNRPAPALSAVVARPPAEELDGWLVSTVAAQGPLRLVDCSPVGKFVLRAQPAGGVAAELNVQPGRIEPFDGVRRVQCVAPGEWLLFCPGEASDFLRRLRSAVPGEHLAAVDVTHGRTLLRLTGSSASQVVSSLCTLDLSARGFPAGSATYAPVAGVRTGIARDDVPAAEAGFADSDPVPSFLLHCDRSLGRHLYDELRSAGERFGLQDEGFAPYRARRAAV